MKLNNGLEYDFIYIGNDNTIIRIKELSYFHIYRYEYRLKFKLNDINTTLSFENNEILILFGEKFEFKNGKIKHINRNNKVIYDFYDEDKTNSLINIDNAIAYMIKLIKEKI